MAKYTDEQVKQYMGYVGKNFGSKYSPDQMKQYESYVRGNFGDDTAKGPPSAELPLGHEDNPHTADLYGSDVSRAKASFGDTEGVTPLVAAGGFTEVKKNKAGQLVAKGPDGKFYRDASQFTQHPVNWLESKAGGALPLAGMVAGGALGEGVASVPLAGAGSAAGEAGRIALGKQMGVYKGGAGDAALDIAGEGAGGAAAELGGKIIGRLPIPGTGKNVDALTKAGLEKLLGYTTRGATRVSQAMTGVDRDAFMRQLLRPRQVNAALEPGNALAVSRAAQDEMAARAAQEGSMISDARGEFMNKHGGTEIDTSPAITSIDEAVGRNQPNSAGHSGLKEGEFTDIAGIRDALHTTQVTPGMYTNTTTQVPRKTIGELRGTTDKLQQDISDSAYTLAGPTRRSEKSQGVYQRVLGQLKDAFHKQSPELATADARFSDYAGKRDIMGPLNNDAGAEGFVSNMFGANKGARQEAAQTLIPKSYESMADIGARKAMQSDRFSKLGPSAPAIVRSGVSMGSGMAGYAASGGSLEGGLLGLGLGTAVSTATSPMVHREMYNLAGKYGMPAMKALSENPQIAPAILDAADLKRLKAYGQNIWSQMQKENPQ